MRSQSGMLEPAVASGRGGRAVGVADEVRLGVLTRYVPPELVDEALAAAGAAERRTRKLPARLMVYFVLALCLFSGADRLAPPGYRPVLASLLRRLPRDRGGYALPVSSALTRARQRLGVAPLRLLLEQLRGPLAAPGTPGAFALGLRLVSWDGALLETQDTAGNAEAFGSATGLGDPQVRLMTLIECGTHAVIDAVFDGAAKASEHRLAEQLVGSLAPGMLLLADRLFPGYQLWGKSAATGADLLWRAKANSVFVPVAVLPDGSYLSVMPTAEDGRRHARARFQQRPIAQPPHGHTVRVIDYQIAIAAAGAPARTERLRLITTLLDWKRHPAHALAALYPQRWESETGYGDLKSRLKGAGFALRSKTPDLARQEIYALLASYQALCQLQTEAAAADGADPDRISFTVTLRTVRDSVPAQAARTPQTLDHARRAAISEILEQKLPARRLRTCPRQVKPTHTRKYPPKRRDQRRPPTNVTRTIKIDRTVAAPARAP